ncbi:MAG: arginine--tRNA ligase [Legionellales bacterium]|nr:arginine--tRNA ligase [Legionellales bacterium]|tara:strand:+ start:32862 stop:34628 length:1767 start_codon:yes stop_codon:yes gene_type:complete
MKKTLADLVKAALDKLVADGTLTGPLPASIQIEHTRDKQFGDFACNIAMMLAKPAKRNPRELAQAIIDNLPDNAGIEKIEIAGPGFINFYLTDTALHSIIEEILLAKADYGKQSFGDNQKINVEFVSANPTGPLHVGHGRGAAYGAALSDLLAHVDYNVEREYYVNDAGRQMNILATSIWLRYLELCGETIAFPRNGYKGKYIIAIAEQLQKQHNDAFHWPAAEVFQNIPLDEQADGSGNKEAHIDGLIEKAKALLGDSGFRSVLQLGLDDILADIRDDLAEFGVSFESWFSERRLFDEGIVEACLERLKASGHTYEKDGNIWFRSTDFDDDKDRVLIRANGQPTYFAADIANHMNKFDRGADKIIMIFGADHHGYVARVRGALKALGIDNDNVHIPLVQFAVLYRGKEKVQMSTRSGEFITLRSLREEVGNDAARFFYTMRKAEQHLDFDLELAKSQSTDNPVYYIQYAHARVCSVFRQLDEKNLTWDETAGLANTGLLLEPQEKQLIETLTKFPEIVAAAAQSFEPHNTGHYLRDLANSFHTYYNAHQFIVDDEALRNARLCLVKATQQVLKNGLKLLGVSAPEQM